MRTCKYSVGVCCCCCPKDNPCIPLCSAICPYDSAHQPNCNRYAPRSFVFEHPNRIPKEK